MSLSIIVQFKAMVSRLFKSTDFNESYAGLLHAIIGLSSEIPELEEAFENNDSTNVIEEMGDCQFYLFSAIQEFDKLFPSVLDNNLANLEEQVLDTVDIHSKDNFLMLYQNCSLALDEIKRGWAHNKTVNSIDLLTIIVTIDYILFSLASRYKIADKTVILEANMHKLSHTDTGRYKDQVYSDNAANARNDKVGTNDSILAKHMTIDTDAPLGR